MLTVPEERTRDKGIERRLPEYEIERAREWLRRAVDRKVGPRGSFAERERVLLELSNEVCRRNLAAELQSLACMDTTKYVEVDGQRYQYHQRGAATYHSLCGSMRIERPTYRLACGRNGPTIVPLEKRAGLIARATPALAYRVALGDAQCPGRQWEQQLKASFRSPPSRSTLERIAKNIGTAAKHAAPEIEPVVRQLESFPADTCAIALGLDRTTVPMEEPRHGRPDPFRKRRKKPYIRKRPERIDVNYRMAYVGTVTLSDRDGDALATLRYCASADEGPRNVVANMMSDLRHALRARRRAASTELRIGVVQDAAPELWSLIEDALRNEPEVTRWHAVVDRFHLTERLAQALQVLPLQKIERERQLSDWRLQLERDDTAIDRIERYLILHMRNYNRNCERAHRRSIVSDHTLLLETLRYIRNHKAKMRYASVRALGLPTGSGTTEGACKSLVMIRAKRCGQRWHTRGINSVLALRAYYLSERLPAFWSVFTARRIATLRAVA